MIAEILALTILRIVSNAFTRDANSEHKCFRIKSLKSEEIVYFSEQWSIYSKSLGLENARLIVADDLEGKIIQEFRAEPGLSITYYRNNNQNGLVYLETTVQSDEQGLQNLFTLRDSNLLDGSFDEYAGGDLTVSKLILHTAWQMITNSIESAPTLLIDRSTEIITLIHPDIDPVPVRRFIGFALEACRQWVAFQDPIDSNIANRLIGECLWQLELFPDIKWRDTPIESRIKRRLELNSSHADLLSAGIELVPEEIIKAVKTTVFNGARNEALQPDEIISFRTKCVEFIKNPTINNRKEIPYYIFEQLFRKDSVGLKLGSKVLQEIEDSHPDRRTELLPSGIIEGLNSKSQVDAERLLSLGNDQGLLPIVDLLTSRTRKAVERLAAPPKTAFFNPAFEIVRIFKRYDGQEKKVSPSQIKLELSAPIDPENFSYGLFAFLFSPSLAAIAEHLKGVPGSCELIICDSLTTAVPPPSLEEDSDSDEIEVVSWLPIPIKVTLTYDDSNAQPDVEYIEWAPDNVSFYAFLWLLASDEKSPLWDAVGELTLSDTAESSEWVEPYIQRSLSMEAIKHSAGFISKGQDTVIDNYLDARKLFKDQITLDGLSVETINTLIDTWTVTLEQLRFNYIPDGSSSPTLKAILCDDTIYIKESARRLMLPLHPLRLRWISAYLKNSIELASQCLGNQAEFATGDCEQYLDWLETLTPHEHPPTLVNQAGDIHYARAETAWFEDFALLDQVTGDISVDMQAMWSIAKKINSYLDAHPYKRDGLNVLIILPPSDDLPAELIRLISKAQPTMFRISLTVAVQKYRWETIAKRVEALSTEERNSFSGLLFPARDLSFIEYKPGDNLTDLSQDTLFDISIVTHILQESIISQQNTEPPLERSGRFNPLFDRPMRLEPAGDGGAISLVMRPRDPDFLLETWGTLVVRSNRGRPVSPTQPENVDFVDLRINFQNSASTFNTLHKLSQWVITLERHISREQIESIEAGAPDVLSVENDVGENGLNTLIVSSSSGRALIESRLVRKLKKLVPEPTRLNQVYPITDLLAKRIYDETRLLSPHLALRAMGVARVTEEILGLCIARRFAEELFPVTVTDGLTSWISLDENSSWLGGPSQVRADMARITLEKSGQNKLHVKVLVVEGKLRLLYDSHGVTQVKRTCDFFQAALSQSSSQEVITIDSEMWRDRILSAMEATAAEAKIVITPNSPPSEDTTSIPSEFRQIFRAGNFDSVEVNGLYSACLWGETENIIKNEFTDDVCIIKSTRAHILEMVNRQTVTEQPLPSACIDNTAESASDSDNAINLIIDKKDLPLIVPLTPDSTLILEKSTSSLDLEAPYASIQLTDQNRGMSPDTLRHIYNEILSCYASHNIDVKAVPLEDTPFIEGPASILFKLRTGSGVDPKKLFEKAQSLKLQLQLEQEQSISFDIDRGFVTIDVPKQHSQRYYVDASDIWRRWTPDKSTLSVAIGEDRFGKLVHVNFSSPNSPHLLVAGTTGSGKSEALNAILFGLVKNYSPTELKLLLVDPKGTELLPFENTPYLLGNIGWDDVDAIQLLTRAVEEMQTRYTLFRENKTRSLAEYNATISNGLALPWWLIVLDEYADLTSDPQMKKDIENLLKRLAQKARASGIHVIIATQKPSADVISTNLRSNLPAQLALRVKSSTESRVVLDEAGAEALNGKGDALLKADGKLIRVQCARVGVKDQVVPS